MAVKISSTSEKPTQITADAVVVGVYDNQPLAQSGSGPTPNWVAEVDQAIGGTISQLLEDKEIKADVGKVTPLLVASGVAAKQVIVAGLGKREEFSRGAAFRAAGSAALQLAAKSRKRVAFYLGQDWSGDQIESGLCGALVGCQGQDLFRSEKKRHPFEEILWADQGPKDALENGRILGECVNLTRRLVNEPPNNIYPESFAAEARQTAEETGLEIEIWDENRLQAERCGSLLAVARGSAQPPRLVLLTHRGGKKTQPPLALVGKGVTFDSGGLSLKPTDNMKLMKCDMAGAATVLGAMRAISLLKLPRNVIGLCGLVENMVSGDSYKLGDVLTARSGKTIEVLNTDAEGRLVLADVLNVALDHQPEAIIDLATLTGACVVALGMDVAGLMSNNQAWCDEVAQAARKCGEDAWQLPMFIDYGEQIKSDIADIKNVGEGRWGGAITAAKFLEEFVSDTPWTHIDIAGPAFIEKPKSWIDGGGSGAFVRTLVEIARRVES